MKKTILALGVFAIATSILPSCEKCITCTYDFGGVEYSSGEVCGKSDDVDAVEAQYEAAAALVGVPVTCERS
jgi:hypothetical protein